MANYSNLINSIKAVIKQNGTNDITGQLMQDVLVAMTNSIGRFATFAGVASPTTNPGTIDQNVFFLHQSRVHIQILAAQSCRRARLLHLITFRAVGICPWW
jgi:hypothetical protein